MLCQIWQFIMLLKNITSCEMSKALDATSPKLPSMHVLNFQSSLPSNGVPGTPLVSTDISTITMNDGMCSDMFHYTSCPRLIHCNVHLLQHVNVLFHIQTNCLTRCSKRLSAWSIVCKRPVQR